MKTLCVPKGKHRPNNRWPLFKFYWNKKNISGKYRFTESCRYNLHSADQEDWNKLIGLSFSFNPHKNSARIAWRYSIVNDCIELGYYIYADGQRSFKSITEVNIGVDVYTDIEKQTDRVKFSIHANGIETTEFVVNNFWGKGFMYHLGLYFGGNQTAPQDIKVIKYEKPYI